RPSSSIIIASSVLVSSTSTVTSIVSNSSVITPSGSASSTSIVPDSVTSDRSISSVVTASISVSISLVANISASSRLAEIDSKEKPGGNSPVVSTDTGTVLLGFNKSTDITTDSLAK